MYAKRFWVRALARAQTYVSSHNMGSHIKLSFIWCRYTCEYMHVYREVLTVSTGNGTYKCEIAQHGLIYKGICDGIYVYLWHMYEWMQRGSMCEHSQGHRHMLVRTTRSHTQKYLWYEFIYIYIYIYLYLYKVIIYIYTVNTYIYIQ